MKHLIAAAAVAAGLMAAGSASATVVLSENFDGIDVHAAGFDPLHPGFTTEYAFRTGLSNAPGPVGMWDEGTWTINNNPYNTHYLWRDEDLGSNVLILNGKQLAPGQLSSTAWAETANGVGGGHYSFSFDAYDVCCNASFGNSFNAASLLSFGYALNGGATNGAAFLDTSTSAYLVDAATRHYHVNGSFNLAGPGALTVSLMNSAGAPGGNDFAIDNIVVAGGVPEPASWALMVIGFGGLGAMLRANRRRSVQAPA